MSAAWLIIVYVTGLLGAREHRAAIGSSLFIAVLLIAGAAGVFPVMLRFAVVKALASLSERVNRQQQVRESAYLWSNRLAASARRSEQSLSKMLSLLEVDPLALDPYFATCLTRDELV